MGLRVAGQAFAGEDRGPLLEGHVRGNDGGAALVALAEDLEQQLAAAEAEPGKMDERSLAEVLHQSPNVNAGEARQRVDRLLDRLDEAKQ